MPGINVLTQKLRTFSNAWKQELERLMQTRSVGGVSLTLQTAEAVKPYRMPADLVVTTLTQRRGATCRCGTWLLDNTKPIGHDIHVGVQACSGRAKPEWSIGIW